MVGEHDARPTRAMLADGDPTATAGKEATPEREGVARSFAPCTGRDGMTLPAPSGDRSEASVLSLRPELERGRRLTDLGNAERLVMRHGHDLRYCAAIGAWLVWDGARFRPDDSGEVSRRMKETTLSLYTEAADGTSADDRAALVKHAVASERAPRIKDAIDMAKTDLEVQVRPEDLDSDPMLFNVANGIIDLRTGKLLPHSRDALCTKLAPVALENAQCPRFMQFLDEIFAGDAEIIGFIQRLIGYSMTGDTTEQCFALLYGTGANGKTTLLSVMRLLFGDYHTASDFGTFLERHAQGPRNDVARLRGARVVVSSESGEGKRFDESLLKSLTGGDRIAARQLYREATEFDVTFKLWLAANHRPDIRGVDEGIWRRVRLIPFDTQIPEAERDPNLLDALKAELSGILGWALDGCLSWQREGLGTPGRVLLATADYREESDVLGTFLGDCCEIGAGYSVSASLLFTSYQAWAGHNGLRPMSNTAFGRKLGDRHFGTVRESVGTVRLGIRLSEDRRENYRIVPHSSERFL